MPETTQDGWLVTLDPQGDLEALAGDECLLFKQGSGRSTQVRCARHPEFAEAGGDLLVLAQACKAHIEAHSG
jgi:hypothetical protein